MDFSTFVPPKGFFHPRDVSCVPCTFVHTVAFWVGEGTFRAETHTYLTLSGDYFLFQTPWFETTCFAIVLRACFGLVTSWDWSSTATCPRHCGGA